MSKYKTFWITKCSGNTWIEYDEPMTLDWTVCKKTEVIERRALDDLKDLLQRINHEQPEVGEFYKIDEFLKGLGEG